MAPGTHRRLRLGVAGVLLALVVTVLVQVVLLRANTTATVAEAYGIAVGFGLAMPLLQAATRPLGDGTTALGATVNLLIALASLAAGLAVVTALLSMNISGSLTVAGGAASAYIGGMIVRSTMVGDGEEEDQSEEQAGNETDTAEKSASSSTRDPSTDQDSE